MTQKQVDNLMKPRIKVIANYYQGVPGISNNKIRIGDIFMNLVPQQDIVWRRFKDGRFDDETIHTPYEYPNLFRKLEWWEDRTPEEMPEYVKCYNGRVSKLTKGMVDYGTIVMEDYLPATEQEYLNYQQSKA